MTAAPIKTAPIIRIIITRELGPSGADEESLRSEETNHQVINTPQIPRNEYTMLTRVASPNLAKVNVIPMA